MLGEFLTPHIQCGIYPPLRDTVRLVDDKCCNLVRKFGVAEKLAKALMF
jgi:hypothetical protein